MDIKTLSIIALILTIFLVALLFAKPQFSLRKKRKIQTASEVLKKLADIQSAGAKLNYLREINHFVFEELVLTAFERRGYFIKRGYRYTGDGGIDGEVWIGGQHYLIQCKRYGKHIDKSDVVEFSNLCAKRRARGFFVHTGKTGEGAKLSAGGNIEFISGSKLIDLCR